MGGGRQRDVLEEGGGELDDRRRGQDGGDHDRGVHEVVRRLARAAGLRLARSGAVYAAQVLDVRPDLLLHTPRGRHAVGSRSVARASSRTAASSVRAPHRRHFFLGSKGHSVSCFRDVAWVLTFCFGGDLTRGIHNPPTQ